MAELYKRFCPIYKPVDWTSERVKFEHHLKMWGDKSISWEEYKQLPSFNFPTDYDWYDFSDSAAIDMYSYETFGKPLVVYYERNSSGKYNGYVVGKHWLSVHIEMWKESIAEETLYPTELSNDYPEWFLIKSGIL